MCIYFLMKPNNMDNCACRIPIFLRKPGNTTCTMHVFKTSCTEAERKQKYICFFLLNLTTHLLVKKPVAYRVHRGWKTDFTFFHMMNLGSSLKINLTLKPLILRCVMQMFAWICPKTTVFLRVCDACDWRSFRKVKRRTRKVLKFPRLV